MSLSGTIRAGAAYVEVTAQTSKLQRGLANAQAQLQQFGRSCTAIGKDMLMLSGAFAVPMAMAVKGFADFDDQMRLVRAVTKATKQEFESLTQVAAKLGRETSFTAKQVADGMVSLGRMGFSPKEIEQAIQPTLDLARATGTDLGEAANIAANSMRIFGIEASKMSDVADILTATANGSAQTLTDLFEALKMAGPQAKAAGENITDTSAALGVLANLGIKGSLAGTALRKSFSQFAKTKVQDKLKAVGISTVDANGNLRKMAEIIADIGRVMATMPSAEKLAFAEDIFDIRGSLAGLSLGGNVKDLDAFIEKLYDVKGTARTTAQEMDAGLGGSFRKLLSAVEGAMNAIGKALEGTLKPFIDKVTAATLAVIKWIEANSGMVTAFAATIAGTAALGAALIVIGVAAKGAAAGFAVVQTALKGFTFIQGMCIAQGVALKNSISLIGAAFVNFRNVAIPAMVGTEQLCVAFGLASTAANRTAASIVLMSNAEAAATAKSILAAKWTAMTGALKAFRTSAIAATIATKAQAAAEAAMAAKSAIVAGWTAMTNALKGMTLATAAATVSTYAHTAAEAICTAGTIALNKARQIAIATTALFTAANLKAVVSISAVTVGNFLLAAAAKVAAVAMMALSAVMTLIAAHPVAAALIALGAILAGVCIYLYRAANYTAKLSDEAGKLREKNDELRKTDQLRMERLKQLSEKQRLTNAEMAEARQLAKELRSRYGDLGISISNNAVRIRELDSAAKRLGAVQLRVENGEDMEKLKRLKELSLKVNLSVPEQDEAAGLIEDLSGRYGDLGMEVDRTKKKIILLSAAAQRLQGIRLVTKVEEPGLGKFDRLKSLSLEAKLTFEQQGDAEALISELSEKYGDLGIAVNRTTGQIERLNTVAGSIADLTFKVRGTEDIQKLQRLKQLSLEADLTVDGQKEAARLIAELTAKYGDLGLAVETIGAKVAAVNDAVAHIDRVRVAVDDRDLLKFNRLKALTPVVRLDVQGQEEAESLIGELSERYSDLGLAVDKTTGKIVQLNTVAGNLKTAELTITDNIDLAKIHDLQGMSLQTELTFSGMDSAERIIGELERKYGSLGVTVDRTSRKIVALTEAANRVRNIELSVSDGGDLEKLSRLKDLSMQVKLDVRGQQEAETLIADLSKRYGDLGLAVDKTSGRIERLNTLAGSIIDLMVKVRGTEDIRKLQRLKELSLEAELTVSGQEEAARLVAELSKKYGAFGLAVETTGAKIAAVNDAVAHMDSVRVAVDANDLKKFDRLKQLTMTAGLTVEGQEEAANLIADLSKRYGELGVEVDRTAGKIVQLNTVSASLRDAELRITARTDLDELNKLRSLSFKTTLTVEEQGQAEAMIRRLEDQYGNLGIAVDRTSGRIAALNETASRIHSIELAVTDNGDLEKFRRLKELSVNLRLNTEGQQEAEELISGLSKQYGDLGIAVDKASGRIVRLNTVAGNLQDVSFRIRGDVDRGLFDRLKNLSMQGELSIEGQDEAARIITDLTRKYGSLGVEVDRTAGKILAVNARIAQIGTIQFRVNADDLEKFDRLKALTQVVSLDVQGQAEAETLISDLSKRYGDLGIAVDKVSGKIVRLNTVAGNLKAVELKVTDKVDLAKIHDLQGMTLQANLTVSGMDSAERMITELERKYGSLGVMVDRTSGKIIAMNDAASRVRNIELGVTDNGDLKKLSRLKALTQVVTLNVQGQNEAEALIAGLSKKYGDLGLAVDRASGKIIRLNSVAGKLQDVRFRIQDEIDLKKFDRLKELSIRAELTTEGHEEAQRLVSELTAKYGDLGIAVESSRTKIAAVNALAAHMAQIRTVVDDSGLRKFARLKELTQVVRLDLQGQTEAETLISDLSKRYGDLGLAVDKVSGKIVRLNTVAANLRSAELTITDKVDLAKIHDLQGMSLQANLTVSGMDSSERMITELERKYGSLGVTVDRTAGKIIALTDAASRVRNIELGITDNGDLKKLARLKTLSMQAKVDVQGQQEAEALITTLSKRYGDLGLAVDRASGKVVRLNTVAGKLQDVRFRIQDEIDLKKFDRLKNLSAEVTLTAEGHEEAQRLIAELSKKYGDLGITVDKTAVRIAALNKEAARIAAVELDVKDSGDLGKLRKLKALSLEVTLDVDRQNEAESLIAELSKKYGDLGVSVDRTTGKIVRLNSVAASLREIRIKVSGTEDAAKVARLQTLAAMPKLDASGINEANTLIGQLKAKYGELGLSVDAASGRIVALTEAQKKFAEVQNIIKAGNDPLKETHLSQLERLKKLSEQEKLTAAEQAEAQSIVNALNGAYNGLGLGIDAITGKLNLAAGAQQKLNDAMKQATLAELDAEIAELESNIRELGRENDALLSYWNHNLMAQMTGRQQESVNKIQANGDKMAVMRQKIGALKQRKQAVQQDKPGATTGTDGKPGSTTAENYEAEKQRRQQSQDAADQAAKRVAEIDKKLARERKTDLENEIDDINALKDEYKALIQTMLDYEKSKPEGQQDKAKIADLEGKLKQADVTAKERIAKAQEKAAEKMKKDVADFQRSFDDAQKSVRERRAEDAQDRKIDDTLKSDKDAGIQMLQGLVRQYQQAAEAARQQFQRELQAAQADGKIDDSERERIHAAQTAYTRAESLVDKYMDKLRSAQDGTQSAADRSQTTGSFLAAALNDALGGGGNEAERTANATEQVAKTTKETNRILKKMGKGGSDSTLAYA